MERNLEIALTKCFICGKDNEIIMNKRLTERDAKMVKEMHGKVVTTEPCNECKEHMKQGIICISVLDNDNEYRTGNMCVVKDEFFKEVIKDEKLLKGILKKRICFIDNTSWKQLNFPINNKK